MLEVSVIDDPAAAEVSLDPVRARLLARLHEPGSATTLAGALGIPRQRVNYHLRTLEQHGLVTLVEERRKGNMRERVLQATARSYVISPDAAPPIAPDPRDAPDRLSAQWLLALAASLVRDVGRLVSDSARAKRRLATFALDATVRFRTSEERAAFTDELTAGVMDLVGRYHDETAAGGRDHRLVIAIHPVITRPTDVKDE